MSTLFYKRAAAVLDYTENWVTWLGDDTISTSDWEAETGITIDSETETTTTATVWLSGGTVDNVYTVTNTIVTAAGRTQTRTILIAVTVQGAFTYLGDMSTELDQMRFALSDTVEGSGPFPGGGNFTDGELNGLNTNEGNWESAVGAAFGMLAARWAKYVNISTGPRSESLSKIADNFTRLAEQWGGLTPTLSTGKMTLDFAEHVET